MIGGATLIAEGWTDAAFRLFGALVLVSLCYAIFVCEKAEQECPAI